MFITSEVASCGNSETRLTILLNNKGMKIYKTRLIKASRIKYVIPTATPLFILYFSKTRTGPSRLADKIKAAITAKRMSLKNQMPKHRSIKIITLTNVCHEIFISCIIFYIFFV